MQGPLKFYLKRCWARGKIDHLMKKCDNESQIKLYYVNDMFLLNE